MIALRHRLTELRARRSELENHLIDAYLSGTVDRREFLRRGTVLGLGASALGTLLAACGSSEEAATEVTPSGAPKVRPGGAIRVGINRPAAAIDPLKVADDGGVAVLAQCGEYLVWSDAKLNARPRLAESWRPNADASRWTFKIRQGVKFHDGRVLTAEDVAASINRLADPANGSAALSAFGGVIGKGAATATDASTVEFELESPNGNFPYLVSSDNVTTIILPRDYDGDYEKTMNGTGPFKLERFDEDESATFVKNPGYWDATRRPNPDRTELRFFAKEQARVLALQGGEIDAVGQFSVSGGKALLNDPNIQTAAAATSTHRQIHMRTDKEPFQDKRVRQALALLIDRDALVDGLLDGYAQAGNDSPFAPVFPYTDRSIPSRRRDVAQARQLLADAGKPEGFAVELATWDGFEIPDLAQVLQSNVKEVGIDVKLRITSSNAYYGDAVFGSSPWLDSSLGITDYGHRGVVNVFLGAPLTSKGTWNSAHFENARYDRLVRDFTAQVDIEAQKRIAREIQTLLLDETPLAIPYFYEFLTATRKGYGGMETTGIGHVQLTGAGQTA